MCFDICNTLDKAKAPCDRTPFLPNWRPSFEAKLKSSLLIYDKSPLICFNNTSTNANISESKKDPETRNDGNWNRNVVSMPAFILWLDVDDVDDMVVELQKKDIGELWIDTTQDKQVLLTGNHTTGRHAYIHQVYFQCDVLMIY